MIWRTVDEIVKYVEPNFKIKMTHNELCSLFFFLKKKKEKKTFSKTTIPKTKGILF